MKHQQGNRAGGGQCSFSPFVALLPLLYTEWETASDVSINTSLETHSTLAGAVFIQPELFKQFFYHFYIHIRAQ